MVNPNRQPDHTGPLTGSATVSPLDRGVCRGRPPEWWDTGDEGNRLALLLCRCACPAKAWCLQDQGSPVGVVRAGDAYDDDGLPAPICACGRPILSAFTESRRLASVRGDGEILRRGRPDGSCHVCSAAGPLVRVRHRRGRKRIQLNPELVAAARALRAEMLADGRPSGCVALTVALRERGWQLPYDRKMRQLTRLLREEQDPARVSATDRAACSPGVALAIEDTQQQRLTQAA